MVVNCLIIHSAFIFFLHRFVITMSVILTRNQVVDHVFIGLVVCFSVDTEHQYLASVTIFLKFLMGGVGRYNSTSGMTYKPGILFMMKQFYSNHFVRMRGLDIMISKGATKYLNSIWYLIDTK